MKKILLIIMSLGILFSCSDDYLDITPSDKLAVENALTTIKDAKVALNGVYDGMQSAGYYGNSMPLSFSVMGDATQTSATGKRTQTAYHYSFTKVGGYSGLWNIPYYVITQANSMLSVIDALKDGTTTEKNNIKGQLYAIRALAHFDLVRIHGVTYTKDNGASLGVPYIKEPVPADYAPERETVASNYDNIVLDLTESLKLLSKDVSPGYINYWTAKALLARVLLYQGKNTEAYNAAVEVIDSGKYTLVSNADYIASWNGSVNSESLFDLINSTVDNEDRESFGYVIEPEGYNAVIATDDFLALMSSDANDVRNGLLKPQKDDNTRNGYIAKYPGKGGDTKNNNVKIIRLSEVYLIAAEAAVKENDIPNAIEKIKKIL